MKKLLIISALLMALFAVPAAYATPDTDASAVHDTESAETGDTGHGGAIDAKKIIFEHLGDRYGWEVPFCHDKSIPLPIVVCADDGFHCFSSARVDHGAVYKDGDVTFIIAPDGEYRGKVVEVKSDGEYVRPIDISITKNVLAIFIACIIVAWCAFALKRWLTDNPFKAPRKTLGAIEAIVLFIYDSVVKSTLRDKAAKYAPYLLTVFMFIFFMNLLGLVVVFPGGANVTGNVAITLTLALLTFFFTNLFATKHYWKEIFWPDVPIWLKFPLPIMQLIEVFGMFTKPAALTVRLFANMMGGHMIVIVLTLLIFIFGNALGNGVGAGTAVVSTLFSVFMLLIDVLVSFIQAYVFTMLSTVFISQAQAGDEHHGDRKNAAGAVPADGTLVAATENVNK